MRPSHKRFQSGAIGFWLLLLLILAVAAIGGGIVGYWVFKNVDARLLLTDQPAMVTIPAPLEVTADVLNNLDITLDDTISTKVPIDQVVSIPVDETLHLIAKFDAMVPIKLDVNVQQTISLDQEVYVDAVVEAQVLGDTLQLPIRGNIPIKAEIPINLTIPIDQKVRLKFTAPVAAKLRQNLTVPLKTTIDADIPIHADLSVPVTSAMKARVYFPPEPTRIIIEYADLKLPLRTLQLGLKDGEEAATEKEATKE